MLLPCYILLFNAIYAIYSITLYFELSMNIKLSISLLLFFGVISGCSNNNSIEIADTPVENVAEEQLSVEEDVEIDDGVVEGMGHDYNDSYYTEIRNRSGNRVQDNVGFEERGDVISDEFAADPDGVGFEERGDIISDEFAADPDNGVVEGMGHDYNDPYYTNR